MSCFSTMATKKTRRWAFRYRPTRTKPLLYQLYHRTAAQVDVAGKDVLEVGCGHGGGLRTSRGPCGPASYTGLDLNPVGVGFCQKRHRVAGLQFVKRRRGESAFPRSVLRCGDQRRVFASVSSVSPLPRRGNSRSTASWRAFPLRRSPDTVKPSRYGKEQLQDAEMSMISCMAINEQVMRGMEKTRTGGCMVDRLVPHSTVGGLWCVATFCVNAFRTCNVAGCRLPDVLLRQGEYTFETARPVWHLAAGAIPGQCRAKRITANLRVVDIRAANGFYTGYLGLNDGSSASAGWPATPRRTPGRTCSW